MFKVIIMYSFKTGSLIDNFESIRDSENRKNIIERFKTFNGAEEQFNLLETFESAERNTDFVRTKKHEHFPTPERHETDDYTHLLLYKSANYEFSKIMDAVKELSSDDHLYPRITFLDFAGQSVYYAFQQIYFSPETCYILVVDMTKKPNEEVHATDEKCCSLFESWIYKGT